MMNSTWLIYNKKEEKVLISNLDGMINDSITIIRMSSSRNSRIKRMRWSRKHPTHSKAQSVFIYILWTSYICYPYILWEIYQIYFIIFTSTKNNDVLHKLITSNNTWRKLPTEFWNCFFLYEKFFCSSISKNRTKIPTKYWITLKKYIQRNKIPVLAVEFIDKIAVVIIYSSHKDK